MFIFESFDLKLATPHTPKVQADVIQYFGAHFVALLDKILVITIVLKCFSRHPRYCSLFSAHVSQTSSSPILETVLAQTYP